MADTKKNSEVEKAALTLADINNVDQALEYARSQGDVVLAAEMGDNDGFKFVADKSRLVGTNFVIVDVQELVSNSFGSGVTVKFVTAGGYRGKFVDFSTGINRQLRDLAAKSGQVSGVVCGNGLLRSEYDTVIDGRDFHGVTYYLDTAPAGESGHIV